MDCSYHDRQEMSEWRGQSKFFNRETMTVSKVVSVVTTYGLYNNDTQWLLHTVGQLLGAQ